MISVIQKQDRLCPVCNILPDFRLRAIEFPQRNLPQAAQSDDWSYSTSPKLLTFIH